MSWLTIESDPAVFNTLISDLGVTGVQVEEILGIDAESLNALAPAYGVVFLFKYQGNNDSQVAAGDLAFDLDHIWFAHQYIQNACAMQALLAILLNRPEIDLGPQLSSFRDFTIDFPADIRGETMTNSDLLRDVHNSFSPSEMFRQDPEDGPGGEAPYHFVSYAQLNGRLYELDGLRAAPIDHGPCERESDFGAVLERVLRERITCYPANEVHFNLLGLTKDPLADGGPHLTDDQRQRELEKREERTREVALRRHGFAGLAIEVTKLLIRSKTPAQLEEMIASGKKRSRRGQSDMANQKKV